MDANQTKAVLQSAVKDFIGVCPHCGTKAHFQMLFAESYKEQNRDLIYYVTFKCVPCKKLILETARFRQDEYSDKENLKFSKWEETFPKSNLVFSNKFIDIVPSNVLDDFKEGVTCLQNNCFKASVAMFRRSLQTAVLDLGAKSGNDLIDQIKNLSVLTPDIKDWAHNIRIFGNWGVHPQDDNLKDITEEKAIETQSFIEEFFNYVYVMPSRVAKARGDESNDSSDGARDTTKTESKNN